MLSWYFQSFLHNIPLPILILNSTHAKDWVSALFTTIQPVSGILNGVWRHMIIVCWMNEWFVFLCSPTKKEWFLRDFRPSLVAHMVKNLPAMQETQVWSLGWEDPLRREWQPTPVFLPREFLGRLQSMGSQRARHDWVTNTHTTDLPKP